jgi:hypothetical protein
MGPFDFHDHRFFAIPLSQALVHLDRKWDAIFSFPPIAAPNAPSSVSHPSSVSDWNTTP